MGCDEMTSALEPELRSPYRSVLTSTRCCTGHEASAARHRGQLWPPARGGSFVHPPPAPASALALFTARGGQGHPGQGCQRGELSPHGSYWVSPALLQWGEWRCRATWMTGQHGDGGALGKGDAGQKVTGEHTCVHIFQRGTLCHVPTSVKGTCVGSEC